MLFQAMHRNLTFCARATGALLIAAALAACNGGGDDTTTTTTTTASAPSTPTAHTTPVTPSAYTIGGSVSGLAGSGLVLQNNAGDALAISANGSFTFATSVASGGIYAVTIKTQPSAPTQICTVTAGSGNAAANVTNVVVTCVMPPPFAYAVNMTDNTVSAFTIDRASGALSAIAGSPFSAGATPAPSRPTRAASSPMWPTAAAKRSRPIPSTPQPVCSRQSPARLSPQG